MQLKEFPVRGLLPKEETEAASFLKKYPAYDGSGIVVAILDTGVDPAAAGLQLTPSGKPKIVDLIDCTGSGDVPLTTTDVKPTVAEDGKTPTLTGLTGRTLRLPADWKDFGFRLGMKRAYELYPRNLVSRLVGERKEKFMARHQLLVSGLKSKLAALEAAKPADPGEQELEAKMDLEAQLEILNEQAKNYDDPGPIYDCVVFHDGKVWRAAVDVKEDGDLTGTDALADYRLERKFAYFGDQSKLTYSVNIYDEGKTLSIVTNAGAHGTHVAAITAAYHPNEPALNGLAPGAQVVSLKIGDTRLGSMETGTGLTRAIKAILDTGCDLCNMSYGEDCGIANNGRFITLLRDELINKKQVVFVSSAGNAGPALSTVGAPGGTTSGVISVGAYATAEMMQAEYAMLENVPDTPHTWCSRGPTYDGDKGVTIYAPGAAITSVPQYLLQNSQLMNGTSMSSPNACGNIALLMSALKAEKIPYTPYRITKAIVNTAKDVKDPLHVGFLQVDQAFAFAKKYASHLDQDVFFDVKIGGKDTRGIYLRGGVETSRVFQTSVGVSPTFRLDHVPENDRKLGYEQRLTLVPTQPWARAPEFLLLNTGGRDFSVRVDPTALSPGFHFAEVHAFDTTCVEKGPVFSIPVSVTKPVEIQENTFKSKSAYGAGKIDRQFVVVPKGATYAELEVKAKGPRSPGRFVVHLLQMIPHIRHTKTEQHWYLNLMGDDPIPAKKFKVYEDVMMEICTTQFWSSLGAYDIEFEIKFHGIQVGGDLVCVGGNGFKRIDVSAPLQPEFFSPSVSFDCKRQTLRPTTSILRPLLSRDVLPNERVNCELVLQYDLKLKENARVTIRKPHLDDILYDSTFDSVLLMIHNVHKKMEAFGDIYPKAVKLDKGDYTVRLQIRHDSVDLLESLKSMAVFADIKLDSAISLDFYESLQDLQSPSKKSLTFKNGRLDIGDSRPLFIDCKVTSKEVKHGDLLVGELSFGVGKIEGGSVPALFVVPPEAKQEDSATSSAGEDKPTPSLDAMAEAVRDLKLDYIKKLTVAEEQATLMAELVTAYPEHLPTRLQALETKASSCKTKEDRVNARDQLLALCKAVIEAANEVEVLAFAGTKAPPAANSKEQAKMKKEIGERKKALAQAYYRQAEVWMSCLQQGSATEEAKVAFEESFRKFRSFGDLGELRYVCLFVAREVLAERFGTALKAIGKYLDENALSAPPAASAPFSTFFPAVIADTSCLDVKKLYMLRAQLMQQLKWTIWSEYEDSWTILRFPSDFAVF